MLVGSHVIIYSRQAEADRAFLRDVLSLPHVDVGEGWLIFGLPPSEVAVHPSDENDQHELYLMCDDVARFVEEMKGKGIACGPVQSMGWGVLTQVQLPGGGKLGVYEPRHARPTAPVAAGAAKPAPRARTSRKAARPKVRPKAKKSRGRTKRR